MDGIRKSLAYLTKGCLHEFTMIAALSPKDWRNGAKEATPLLFNRVCRKHQRCYVIVLIGVSAWDELRGADSLKPDSSRLLLAFFAFAHLARQFSFTLQMTVGEHSLQAHSFLEEPRGYASASPAVHRRTTNLLILLLALLAH